MLIGLVDKIIKLWKVGRCERIFLGNVWVNSFCNI